MVACKLLALISLFGVPLQVAASEAVSDDSTVNRQAWFGELHIHSGWSFDSYWHGVRTTPEDAYRYNTGHSIPHFSGEQVRSAAPLDFMALTDHAEYMGFMPLFSDPAHPLSTTDFAANITSPDFDIRLDAFLSMTGKDPDQLPRFEPAVGKATLRTVWQKYIDLADKYYDPGKFTTFVAYEWTSLPNGQNLHRNVIFGTGGIPELPFTSIDSENPEDLWDWLDTIRNYGTKVLAIPHNSNISNGLMFADQQWNGDKIDTEYSEQRMRNEPVVEITQIKGTSETHPILSPLDEWANFEILETLIGRHDVVSEPKGSYVRQAYLDGITFQKNHGFNPYKFGVIGSSDGHNATSPVEENNYTGKLGRLDATAVSRRGGNPLHPVNAKYSASGLAGVWAEENTRESIFSAIKRKEVFATSGPRIRIRLFALWDADKNLVADQDWLKLVYQTGVPMGGELLRPASPGDVPKFIVYALKDPASAALQRAQIIKGWVEDGKGVEKVFDVACSDGNRPDPKTHRCPDNGAGVNVSTCVYSVNSGNTILTAVWSDPEFDANQTAFYYLRVIENPTCRWSTWDSIRNGMELPDTVAATIQERAWSSPIWYRPTNSMSEQH